MEKQVEAILEKLSVEHKFKGDTTLAPAIYKIKMKKDKTIAEVEIPVVEYFDEKYQLPTKLYGNVKERAKTIMDAYEYKKVNPLVNCSCLLVGKAGTGKTVFCKYLANEFIKKGIRVYVLEGTNHSQKIVEFIGGVKNAVVFIDEFGKQFRRWEQDALLSLMSESSRNLTLLLSENSLDDINDFIKNRPGRIRYFFDFDILEEDVIREYCKDNKIKDSVVEEIIQLNKDRPTFCMDHLINIVVELQIHKDKTLQTILSELNVPFLRKEFVLTPIELIHIETGEKIKLCSDLISANGISVIQLLLIDLVPKTPGNFMPNPFENNAQQESTTNQADKTKEKDLTEAFVKRFKKDYESIDIHRVPEYRESRWKTNERLTGERRRSGNWVKINPNEGMLEEKEGEYRFIKDVTGKYKVKVLPSL